jgi:N-acetylglucosaminyldiphosphoundecaprenol N-acetyl-beta-D-mannosaminyltransferase
MTLHAVRTQTLFGLQVDSVTLREVVDRCRNAVNERQRLLVGVVNAAKIVNIRRDPALRDALLECDLIVADGQSVVWASKILGDPLPERVTGIDLFQALLELADVEHRSVYLLGARPEVLTSLVGVISGRYPGLRIAGTRDGYFTDAEAPEVADAIRRAAPDMLFLGIVSPKKEIFLGRHGDSLDVPVLHGVGGSFDILAGITERAPESWQRLGLEWAYRLRQEPRRLWKRYLTTNTRFVLQVLLERIKPTPPWRPSVPSPHHLSPTRKDSHA